MGSTIVSLLPLIIGSAVVPVFIIIVLLLLRGEGGLAKAAAFVGGMTVVRLIQGVLFGLVFSNTETGTADADKSGLITSVLLLVIAILMLVTAGRLLLKEEDPDAPPPKWMNMIKTMTPVKAFGIGAVWLLIGAKHWVFILGALGVINEGNLGTASSVTAFLLFVIGAESLLLIPILFYVIAKDQSASVLERAGTWLEVHNRVIVISVSLIFGAFFMWKSLSGLLA